MAMQFAAVSGYDGLMDEGTIANLIKNILTGTQNEMIILLEPGVGFLAGMVTPFIFGPHLLATEVAWWVNPEFRGSKIGSEFLHAFEYWAKEKAGCKLINMGCLDDRLMKFYENEGYTLHERAYMKVL